MSLPKDKEKFARQSNEIDNAQKLQPCPSGESTPKNSGEAVKARLSNRRRRQRERRFLKSKSKASHDLAQEVESQKLGGDQLPEQAVSETENGQSPGEEQDKQFATDVHMPMESFKDIYFP